MLKTGVLSTCFPGLDLLKTMKPPRFIKTHLPIQLVPEGFWENKCKVSVNTDFLNVQDVFQKEMFIYFGWNL